MSKVNYLVGRLCKQKGVKELDPAEISLDHLLMAYMGEPSAEKTALLKSNKVTPLAVAYAGILHAGRTVVINDLEKCNLYYVRAVEGELIAVYHTAGPWFEIYSAISTSQELLIELGLSGNSFKDHALLDGIFNFPLTGKGIPEVTQFDELEVQPVTSVWKRPVTPKPSTKEIMRRNQEAEQVIADALVTIVEAAGNIKATEEGPVTDIVETKMAAALTKLKTQHPAAFQSTPAAVAPTPPQYGELRRVPVTTA